MLKDSDRIGRQCRLDSRMKLSVDNRRSFKKKKVSWGEEGGRMGGFTEGINQTIEIRMADQMFLIS